MRRHGRRCDSRRNAQHFAIPEGVPYSEHVKAEKRKANAKEAFRRFEKKITHGLIAKYGIRADGRDFKTIRPLTIEAGILARTHGSAFFQRGETQSIVVCTLGTGRNEQIIDAAPEFKKFCLHYNFRRSARVRRVASPVRVGAKSVTAHWRNGRCSRFCPMSRNSPTRSGWSATSPNPTVHHQWRPCAADVSP
jgi:hypothetical protein